MTRIPSLLLICSSLLVPAFAEAQSAPEAKKPVRTIYQRLQPCKVEGVQTEALCGALSVWENRTTKTGRGNW